MVEGLEAATAPISFALVYSNVIINALAFALPLRGKRIRYTGFPRMTLRPLKSSNARTPQEVRTERKNENIR